MSNAKSADVRSIERLARQRPGRKLPGERELAEQFAISRARVRLALDELEATGVVTRRQGSGTYAADTDAGANVRSISLLVDARLRLGDDPFFSTVVERVQQACQAEAIRCALARVGTKGSSSPVTWPEDDGIIGIGLAAGPLLSTLGRDAVPAVGLFVGDTVRSSRGRVSVLDLDDHDAGAHAIELLHQRGCRRIHFVGHSDIPASSRRLAGAREAAAALKLSIRPIEAGMNAAAGIGAVESLPSSNGDAPLGVIAANDWVALGVHTGLSAASPQRRRAVEIVSFDGLPIVAEPSLAIRSLAAPLDVMARDAIAELRRLAANTTAWGRSVTYPMRLAAAST